MRILDFAYSPPHPPRSGYHQRILFPAQAQADRVARDLLCRAESPEVQATVVELEKLYRTVRTPFLRRPNHVERIVKGLRFLGQPYPLSSAGYYFDAMARELERLLAAGGYDIVVMHGIWLCAYWPLLARAKARIVLNLPDVTAEALDRMAAMAPPGWDRWLYRFNARKMRRLEERLIASADLTLVPSERERDFLRAEIPGARIETSRNGIDCAGLPPLPRQPSREVLFVGSLRYGPNIDGLRYFAEAVWPRVREALPDAVFRIVGRTPAPEVLALGDVPGLVIDADVPDLEPYYAHAAVTVVPIRCGGGTRLKVLESMAYSRPVVSTTLGAEGIAARHDEHLLIADDPEAMAAALVRVVEEPALGARLAERGRRLVEAEYDWRAIAEEQFGFYASLLPVRS